MGVGDGDERECETNRGRGGVFPALVVWSDLVWLTGQGKAGQGKAEQSKAKHRKSGPVWSGSSTLTLFIVSICCLSDQSEQKPMNELFVFAAAASRLVSIVL